MERVSKEDLAKIIERHGKWLRDEAGGERANLPGMDLSGMDLRRATMVGADLRWADLTGADLTGAEW